MAKTPVVTKAELEEAINDIWVIAQDTDGGSRVAMQESLDEIQARCVEVCPEIEDQDDTDDEDDDDEDE